eukprot:jgi/Ulvmu1/9839/UM056_0080.1
MIIGLPHSRISSRFLLATTADKKLKHVTCTAARSAPDATSGGSMYYSELTELYWKACCMQFDHSEYWEDRYSQNSRDYEWYLSYSSVAQVIEQHVARDAPILHIGVGTSTMHEEMAASGYQFITNMDYSRKCIDVIRNRWQARRGSSSCQMQFEVADCRNMRSFDDNSFAAVLDKGTMDAMLCAEDDTGNACKMLNEVYRVLSNGGAYLWCTSGVPNTRMPYFQYFGPHALQVYSVGDSATEPLTEYQANAITDGTTAKYYVYVLTKAS